MIGCDNSACYRLEQFGLPFGATPQTIGAEVNAVILVVTPVESASLRGFAISELPLA